MESWWGLPCLAFLCFLMHARGQRDFDLADALDDPEPTKKPNSEKNLYGTDLEQIWKIYVFRSSKIVTFHSIRENIT
ncbi:hypothetical protein H8959_006306 [Pygathrix nigripes]